MPNAELPSRVVRKSPVQSLESTIFFFPNSIGRLLTHVAIVIYCNKFQILS